MELLFRQIKTTDAPLLYAVQKLQTVGYLSCSDAQQVATARLSEIKFGPAESIQLASECDLPRHAKVHQQYAMEVIRKRSPLLDGEKLIDDSVSMSYLLTGLRGLAAGTITVDIETTHAKLLYLFRGSYVENGKIYRLRPACGSDPLDGDESLGVSSWGDKDDLELPVEVAAIPWAALGKTLGNGLLAGIGGRIGSVLFDQIFGGIFSSQPDWFGALIAEFSRIVEQAFEDQWMRELEAGLNALASKIRQYNTARERFMLEDAWSQATELVSALQRIGKPASANFLTGAGMHLLVLQQLAISTEDSDEGRRQRDAYAGLIRELCVEYADWITARRNEIHGDRMGRITGVRTVRNPGNHTYVYSWCDGRACRAYQNTCSSNGYERAVGDRREDYNSVNARITAELAPLLDVAAQWRRLQSQPIPPES